MRLSAFLLLLSVGYAVAGDGGVTQLRVSGEITEHRATTEVDGYRSVGGANAFYASEEVRRLKSSDETGRLGAAFLYAAPGSTGIGFYVGSFYRQIGLDQPDTHKKSYHRYHTGGNNWTWNDLSEDELNQRNTPYNHSLELKTYGLSLGLDLLVYRPVKDLHLTVGPRVDLGMAQGEVTYADGDLAGNGSAIVMSEKTSRLKNLFYYSYGVQAGAYYDVFANVVLGVEGRYEFWAINRSRIQYTSFGEATDTRFAAKGSGFSYGAVLGYSF